jgi:hypothetical protein
VSEFSREIALAAPAGTAPRGALVSGQRLREHFGWAIAIFASAIACGLIVVSGSSSTRLLVAVVAVVMILALFDLRPAAGIIAMCSYLALVAMFRRMLIPAVGWTNNDPLLLVAPVVVTILVTRQFMVERRPLATEWLSYLTCGVFALILLQSLNPRNGSLAVGAGGLLFMGMPMLWFFVSRDQLSRAAVTRLLGVVIGLAVAIATYGFYQSLIGLPFWDQAWVDVAGYHSLYLEKDVTNTFGTFSSTAEYTIFMGVAIAGAVGFGLRGKPLALLALPVLVPAIVLSSNRTGVVFALIAVNVMLTLRFVRSQWVPIVLFVGVMAIAGASPLISSALQSGAANTGNARVEYQLSGLGDPLNRSQSTLTLHAQLFADGITHGIGDPIGGGSGVTNRSVVRFGGETDNAPQNQNTEIDISNSFVSLGLIGGLAYLALLVVAFTFAVRAYNFEQDALSLATVGALIATLGHWLSGGHYAVAPLVWILLGSTAAFTAAQSRAHASR